MTAADGDRQGPAPPFRALLLPLRAARAAPLMPAGPRAATSARVLAVVTAEAGADRAVRSFVEIESAQAASSARM